MGGERQGFNAVGSRLVDARDAHEPVVLECDPAEGMTRQEFKDECDINVLMATYETSGAIPRFNLGTPAYLDVSDVPDLARSIAIMEAAQTAFMTLPASVRREFDNDAVAFVEYASDASNLEQMRKWGLAPPAEPAPSAPAVTAEGGTGASGSPGSSKPGV